MNRKYTEQYGRFIYGNSNDFDTIEKDVLAMYTYINNCLISSEKTYPTTLSSVPVHSLLTI